jgi:hypothetical protein
MCSIVHPPQAQLHVICELLNIYCSNLVRLAFVNFYHQPKYGVLMTNFVECPLFYLCKLASD